jgi:hypothetical protein
MSRRLALLALLAVVVAGCPAAPTTTALDWPEPGPVGAATAIYDLRWDGALIGEAAQRDSPSLLVRTERVTVRRGEAVVTDELYLEITRVDGAATAVRLERGSAGERHRGLAVATAAGWEVHQDGETPVIVPPARPFEEVIARPPGPDGFAGPVLLAGWGFAVAPLAIVADGEDWRATLELDGGAVSARLRYATDGVLDRVASGDGVTAERRRPDAPPPRFAPIEVVDGNALIVDGGAAASLEFPDALGAVPALPGQRVTPLPTGGWRVDLDAAAPGGLPPGAPGPDRSADLADLTAMVADRIADDLGATAPSLGAARTATRGDCTTHALALVAAADDLGLTTRIVTGLRLDGDTLIRHRWVVAWTGQRWLALDPTYRESPARPRLIGLASHGPRAAERAVVDAAVFDRLGRRVRAAAPLD